jgi:hypothetical protein
MPTDVKGITRAREILIVTTLAERYHHVVRQRLAPTRGGTHSFELFRKIRPTMPLQYVYTFLLVATHEGMTVTELSKLAEVAQTVMSRHLLDLGDRNRYMEDGMGLVTMKPDRMDMRRHQVILTPQGRALFTKWCELIRLAGSRR